MVGLTAVLITALAAQQPANRPAGPPQTDQTVPVTQGTRLAVSNFAGQVAIRTWQKDALRVQARHSSRVRVRVATTPAGISVSTVGSGGPAPVDYTITAPSWMAVDITGTYTAVSLDGTQSEVFAETVRGDIAVTGGVGAVTAKSVEGAVIIDGARGRIVAHSVNEGISIRNTTGEIEAETINGGVTMTAIDSGSVDAATVNGNITYDGVARDEGRYRFTTHNGSITLSIPERSNATFTVQTHQGQFSTALPVKGAGEPRGGRRAVYTLGNGSADVQLESFNGTIRLRGAGRVRDGRP